MQRVTRLSEPLLMNEAIQIKNPNGQNAQLALTVENILLLLI